MTASRKRLRPGDIFVVKPRGRDYLFGRVVDVDAHALQIGGAILIYVYDAWSTSKLEIPPLSRDRLLIPPVMLNRLGWSRGFMETVEHRPLDPDEVLPVHCFVSHIYAAGPRYFNERHEERPGPVEPVGTAGLASYRWLDDEISRTIGLPLAPAE